MPCLFYSFILFINLFINYTEGTTFDARARSALPNAKHRYFLGGNWFEYFGLVKIRLFQATGEAEFSVSVFQYKKFALMSTGTSTRFEFTQKEYRYMISAYAFRILLASLA